MSSTIDQTDETRRVILDMEAALGANADNMEDYFHESFRWMGNRGCGTKDGLAAFRAHWQLPFRAAFTDRIYKTERYVCEGEWASCFGHIEATHSGAFMGIAPTGKRIRIPYMDFWKVSDGRIEDNWVSVDFAEVLHQLGRDIFDGQGWEAYDEGRADAPSPD